MPPMPDLAAGYGGNRNTLARQRSPWRPWAWSGAVPGRRRSSGTACPGRPRWPRGNLVKRNLATDSPGYRFPAASGQEMWKHHITSALRYKKLTRPAESRNSQRPAEAASSLSCRGRPVSDAAAAASANSAVLSARNFPDPGPAR